MVLPTIPRDSFPYETDPRLLEALASLNQIGSTINRLAPGESISSDVTLQLIVESSIRVVPGSSAVIYIYNQASGDFEKDLRVSAGAINRYAVINGQKPDDTPRPDGIGMRSIHQRRTVISYEEPDLDVHPIHAQHGVQVASCFPLIVAEQVVGILYVYLHKEREFNRLELLTLANFVNQAAMAIYHTRRLADMRRNLTYKEEELRRLNHAAMLISSRQRLEDTLEAILQLALEVTDAHYGIFRLLDREGRSLVTRALAGEYPGGPQVQALPLDSKSVMGWVARNRQALLIPDLSARPWASLYYPLDTQLTMRSELAVPLINASGRLEGVLNLESPQPGAFDENDRYQLQTLSTYAVTAIQEARLLDALQETAQRLLNQPCAQVLDHLTGVACDLLNAAASAIWLVREEEIELVAASAGHKHGERMPLEGSLTGQAILQRTAVISEDLRTDSRFHRPDLAQAQNWTRALIIPLSTGNETAPIGAFSVYSASTDPGRFAESDWDKKVLTFLAHYVVLAVQNEERQEALRSAQQQRSVAETFAAVGDIASNLLHHLNNKVGTIPVRVQNVEDKCRPALESDPYLAHNLAEIERCATDAMQTVRENLSHLRPIQLEPVYVAARVLDAIRSANLSPGVRLKTEGLDHLPVVMAGGQSLTFVFTNLIENAADAMRGEGTINILGSTIGNSWVQISVADSGPGIPPELHDRIFELNFSGRSASRPGKLGFGLWWVKTLMTRLGGSIHVESDGFHGTTFRLRLPTVEEKK